MEKMYIEIELSWVDLYEFLCLTQLCTYVLVSFKDWLDKKIENPKYF